LSSKHQQNNAIELLFQVDLVLSSITEKTQIQVFKSNRHQAEEYKCPAFGNTSTLAASIV
jgi:hypothetical protein